MILLPTVYIPGVKPVHSATHHPCLICSKPIRQGKEKYWVHLGSGGSHLVTDEEAEKDPAGDMGCFPVGPDCWKNHPEIHPYGWKDQNKGNKK